MDPSSTLNSDTPNSSTSTNETRPNSKWVAPPDPITTLSGVTAILASSFNGILKENGYSPGCLVDLKNQVAIANEEIKVLKEENKSLARQLHAQKERCKSLEMIHTTSHTAHSSIQTKLEESTKEISSLRTENSELFTQRRDAHSHVHRLKYEARILAEELMRHNIPLPPIQYVPPDKVVPSNGQASASATRQLPPGQDPRAIPQRRATHPLPQQQIPQYLPFQQQQRYQSQPQPDQPLFRDPPPGRQQYVSPQGTAYGMQPNAPPYQARNVVNPAELPQQVRRTSLPSNTGPMDPRRFGIDPIHTARLSHSAQSSPGTTPISPGVPVSFLMQQNQGPPHQPQPQPYPHPQTHPQTQSQSHSHPQSHPHPQPHPHPYPHSHPHSQPQSHPQSHSQTPPQSSYPPIFPRPPQQIQPPSRTFNSPNVIDLTQDDDAPKKKRRLEESQQPSSFPNQGYQSQPHSPQQPLSHPQQRPPYLDRSSPSYPPHMIQQRPANPPLHSPRHLQSTQLSSFPSLRATQSPQSQASSPSAPPPYSPAKSEQSLPSPRPSERHSAEPPRPSPLSSEPPTPIEPDHTPKVTLSKEELVVFAIQKAFVKVTGGGDNELCNRHEHSDPSDPNRPPSPVPINYTGSIEELVKHCEAEHPAGWEALLSEDIE
ncbi:hypothetical protein NLI96_g12456 [Meripilus lineatus]|uniref:Uncharacterized protein n=1 Tax=Meripilus lineatus TaxID=2056292 RepID=A0AAD5Y865_9APHY|nr:hypothetical protein NLI96_g12456 [Physisporinus lineatus]